MLDCLACKNHAYFDSLLVQLVVALRGEHLTLRDFPARGLLTQQRGLSLLTVGWDGDTFGEQRICWEDEKSELLGNI